MDRRVGDVVIVVLTAVAAALALEVWARLVHERLWHGPLWFLHAAHHRPRRALVDSNDLLSASHAPPSAALVIAGSWGLRYGDLHGAAHLIAEIALGCGLGATAFGLAYFVVHDGFIHGRLPLAWLRRVPYFARIQRAHLVHHGTGGAPFGMFAPDDPPRRGPR